jgi:Cu/Ag efflux pump CusA
VRKTYVRSRFRACQVLRIVLDRERLARYGIKARDALGVVEAIRAGTVAGTVMEGVRRYEIAIRFDLPRNRTSRRYEISRS